MSSANLTLVGSIYAPWKRGDFRDVGWAHPDIEFVIADGPAPGAWTGLAGMSEGWQGWLSAWQDFRVEVDDYLELDGERVLILARFSGRGRTSGLDVGEMRTMGAALYHLRDGKVIKAVHYWNRERGLAELGLALEQAAVDAPDDR